jgi:hypothetical protein
VKSNHGSTSYNPGSLSYNTKYYWKIVAKDNHGASSTGPIWCFTTTSQPNNPPNKPTTPYTDDDVYSKYENEEFIFNTETTDPNNDDVFYKFEWGNGEFTDWLGPYDSGDTIQASYVWNIEGTYQVKVRAKDIYDEPSEWSDYRIVSISPENSYYFIHITDTHVGTTGGANRTSYVVDQINNLDIPPEFVVVSGDLTHFGGFKISNFVDFFAIISKLEMPVYFCIGNHDHLGEINPIYGWILELFNDYAITPTENIHLISMDSGGNKDYIEGWIWVPGITFPIPILDWIPEGKGLTAAQGSWLPNRLDDYPYYHKILFMHHPVVCDVKDDHYPTYGEGPWNNGCIYYNRDPLMHLLRDKAVKLVLGGHLHKSRQYIVEKINGQNYPRVLEELSFDGYNETKQYWSSLVPPNPIYVTTGPCAEFLEYRKIEIINDELRVYKAKRFPDHPSLVEYAMDLIPLPWKGSDNYIDAAGRLHLYNSTNSHVGVKQDTLGVECEIKGVYYEDEPIENETTGELMNWSTKELINVIVDERDCYNFTIEIFIDSTLNLKGTFIAENNGGVFNTYYQDIEVYAGSIGWLNVDKGIETHILFFDDDNDGIVDREIYPTSYSGNRKPKKPIIPLGQLRIRPKIPHKYIFCGVDGDYNDKLYYIIDWGDGTSSDWMGPYIPGDPIKLWHSYQHTGDYTIRYKTKDLSHTESEFSDSIGIKVRYFPFLIGYSSNNIKVYPYSIDEELSNSYI